VNNFKLIFIFQTTLTSVIYSCPTVWIFAWASSVSHLVKADGSLTDEACKIYFEEFLKLVSGRMTKDRLDSISISRAKVGQPRLTPSINEDSKYMVIVLLVQLFTFSLFTIFLGAF